MSLNGIAIRLVTIGYVVVNILFQITFLSGGDVFAKYRASTTAAEMLAAAREAYYAKTGFLLLLIILMTLGASFPLGLAVSLSAYAVMMLVFFGLNVSTGAYLAGAIVLVATYLYDGRRPAPRAALTEDRTTGS